MTDFLDMDADYPVVELVDDEGNEVEALILGNFEIEEKGYVALLITNDDDNDDIEENIIFFGLTKPADEIDDNEDVALLPIEDDEEYSIVEETFFTLLDSADINQQE